MSPLRLLVAVPILIAGYLLGVVAYDTWWCYTHWEECSS